MKKQTTLPLILTFGVLALAGCTTVTEQLPVPEYQCLDAGDASRQIAVLASDEEGGDPTVDFAPGLSSDHSESTVVTAGTGETVAEGDSVRIRFSLYNASDGSQLFSTGLTDEDTGEVITVQHGSLLPGLINSVACNTVGSRVASVIAPIDAYGETGHSGLGVGADDSLVMVFDIVEKVPGRATGEPQDAVSGMPEITLDAATGQPSVTIPDGEAPTELRSAVTLLGDGVEVEAGDMVTVQYQGVNWRTGEVFDQSWGRGLSTFYLDELIQGFGEGLTGKKVGSQVVIVIPPALGYGPMGGNSSAGILEDDALVFVVDVIAVSRPAAIDVE